MAGSLVHGIWPTESRRGWQARVQVDKLTPSLLARAFAGKLVPQDPTDESAEKLLAGIGHKGGRKT